MLTTGLCRGTKATVTAPAEMWKHTLNLHSMHGLENSQQNRLGLLSLPGPHKNQENKMAGYRVMSTTSSYAEFHPKRLRSEGSAIIGKSSRNWPCVWRPCPASGSGCLGHRNGTHCLLSVGPVSSSAHPVVTCTHHTASLVNSTSCTYHNPSSRAAYTNSNWQDGQVSHVWM